MIDIIYTLYTDIHTPRLIDDRYNLHSIHRHSHTSTAPAWVANVVSLWKGKGEDQPPLELEDNARDVRDEVCEC
jgi:hypothetical protein